MSTPIEMIEPPVHKYMPFDEMVALLFKKMGTPAASLHHAATGIAGECVELMQANSRNNVIEECSDLEFYIIALQQQLGMPSGLGATAARFDDRVVDIRIDNVFNNIVSAGNDILDQSKKSWVYGKPVDIEAMTCLVIVLGVNLRKVYDFFGLSRDEIILHNQTKLIHPVTGRFAKQVYSDDQAIARADKEQKNAEFGKFGQPEVAVPGELASTERKFFGKPQAAPAGAASSSVPTSGAAGGVGAPGGSGAAGVGAGVFASGGAGVASAAPVWPFPK